MNYEKDYAHWAKKFDTVKHITGSNKNGSSVMCRKYGALLGNNYATMGMQICPECKKETDAYNSIQNHIKDKLKE